MSNEIYDAEEVIGQCFICGKNIPIKDSGKSTIDNDGKIGALCASCYQKESQILNEDKFQIKFGDRYART